MGQRILLVDDEEAVLDVFKLLLTRNDYVVDCARGRDQAEAYLLTQKYAAAIVDLTLLHGEKEGMQVLECIAQQPAKPMTVVWSGYPSSDLEQKVMGAGVDDFLSKPVGIKSLLAVLDRLLVNRPKEVRMAPAPALVGEALSA